MNRNGNANAMMLLIILLVISFVFGFLAWAQHDNGLVVMNGRADHPLNIKPDNSLKKTRQQIAELETTLEGLEQQKGNLQLQLGSLRSYLARNGSYWTGKRWIGPQLDPTAENDGQQSMWTTTSNKVRSDLDMLNTWVDSYNDSERDSFDALNNAIDHGRDAIEAIGDQIADEEDSFNNTRDRLIAEQDNLNEKREILRKEGRMRFAELSIKKSKHESRIRDLLELKLQWVQELKTDGEVLSVANAGQHVIVNLGEQDNIKAGMRFEIFAMIHGNHITKGFCEVVDPGPSISTCRVIQAVKSKREPLAEGDLIGNPVFDTNRPQSFVLAGEFENFNAEDLANFIRRSGGIVREKLDPNVDFLVAGLRSDAEQDAAREYRVLAMKEELLVQFLDTTFRPR